MTLIEVIDSARALANENLDSSRSFPDNTSSFWRDSDLINYFNMVQQEVALEIGQVYEDFFLTQTNISIVAGTAEYALPTDFMQMRRVEDRRSTSPREVYPVTINEKEGDLGFYGAYSGSYPMGSYYLKGARIVLTDTPTFTDTSAIRMYYIQRLPDVSGATATSAIPVEHHRILVWGLLRYMQTSQQGQDRNHIDLEYEKALIKLRQYCENRQIQKPRMVKRNQINGR